MIWIVEPFLDLGRDRQEYGVEEENKESKWSLYFILFLHLVGTPERSELWEYGSATLFRNGTLDLLAYETKYKK